MDMKHTIRHRQLRDQIDLAHKEITNIFSNINDAITIHDKDFNITHANKAAVDLLGIDPKRVLRQKCFKSYHGTDAPPEGCPSCRVLKTGKPETQEIFEPHIGKHIEIRAFPRFDNGKKLKGLVHIVRDISERKQMDEQLKETVSKLQQTVKKLQTRTADLKDSNNAFRFLLKQREQDKKELQESIIANIEHLVFPTIKRLKSKRAISGGQSQLNVIESNLREIVSPFTRTLSAQYGKLAPREIEVAHLIRDGMRDKDIAEHLGVSLSTVRAHRRNIRKKLELYGKRANLRTFLQALSK